MDKLDQALSDQLIKLGNATPELVERVTSSYAEYYIAEASTGIWFYSILSLVLAIVAVTAMRKDTAYGDRSGFVVAVFAFITAIVTSAQAVQYLIILKAPEAYAVKVLVSAALGDSGGGL